MNRRVIWFISAICIIYYLVWCFILGEFNLYSINNTWLKALIVVLSTIPFSIIMYTIFLNIEIFFPPIVPHEDKVNKIKRYTGELKEELELLEEAKELERKADEMRKRFIK